VKTLKQILQYVLPLLLAGSILFLVYRNTDIEKLWNDLKKAELIWLLVGIIPATASHIFRALRWQMLLEPMGYKTSFKQVFLALMSGYFANFILPRMGEVTRCSVLYRNEEVPVATSLGTVVTERVFDMICLFIVMCFAFWIEFDKLVGFLLPLFGDKINLWQQQSYWVLVGSVIGFLVIVALFFYLIWSYQDKVLAVPIFRKIFNFSRDMWQSIISVRHLKNPALFLLYSILIWVGYYYMSYFPLFALSTTAHLGWKAGMTILLVGALGMVAPVQGGIGAYHFMVSSGIMLYGISEESAKTVAALLHTYQTVFTISLGGICALLALYIGKEKKGIEPSK
jgi:uncharacterized protein (TIRG00374 family)